MRWDTLPVFKPRPVLFNLIPCESRHFVSAEAAEEASCVTSRPEIDIDDVWVLPRKQRIVLSTVPSSFWTSDSSQTKDTCSGRSARSGLDTILISPPLRCSWVHTLLLLFLILHVSLHLLRPSIYRSIFPPFYSPAIVSPCFPSAASLPSSHPLLLYLLLYLFLLKSQSSSFASRPGRAGLLFLGFY